MNYRETRNGYLNCEKRIFSGVGKYDIPEILSQWIDLEEPWMCGFNKAKTDHFRDQKICHFYIDDYQFERVWLHPNEYLPLLREFKAVLAPDFSLYDDFPAAVNLFNHYRKHWLARYWQDNGVTVIPTICWGDEASLEWCLDGEPRYATISTSCIGCNKSAKRNEKFWKEYKQVMEILQPKRILLFKGASKIEVPDVGAEVIEVSNDTLVRMGLCKKAKTKKRAVV